jgi:hypothetical protein
METNTKIKICVPNWILLKYTVWSTMMAIRMIDTNPHDIGPGIVQP